tara:strand:- start:674 stop:1366 length:693 start_codon:yes stop_codon:yes gene_type:complete
MKSMDNSKIAYVGVHLGFCSDPNNPMVMGPRKIYETLAPIADPEFKRRIYEQTQSILHRRGDYDIYLDNIRTFLDFLRPKSRFSFMRDRDQDKPYFINVVEERVHRTRYNYTRGVISVPQGDITIVTKNGDTEIKDVRRGKEKTDIDSVYAALKEEGRDTVVFIGECAWWDMEGQYRACLGTIASKFSENEFEISSVEGCIFPSKRPADLEDEVIDALYSNTVPLPQVEE